MEAFLGVTKEEDLVACAEKNALFVDLHTKEYSLGYHGLCIMVALGCTGHTRMGARHTLETSSNKRL